MRDENLLSTIGGRKRVTSPKEKHLRFPFHLGVELELENVHGEVRYGVPFWQVHNDESLRNNGLEFVFDGPLYGDTAMQAVNAFYAMPQEYTGGPRTSTHVHVDASKLTVGAMRAIVGLSYVLEEALFNAVLAARKWCGYCMPLTEMAHSRLRALLLAKDSATFTLTGIRANANAEKYYGLNLSSLLKHSTIEYRYFPGAPTKDELLSWMDYATELTAAGMKMEDIEMLRGVENLEQLQALLFAHLPVWAPKLLMQNTDKMMERLFELQGILEEEYVEPTKRIDPLIYVSPQLKGLAVRLLGKNREHRNVIARTLAELEVLSQTEWRQQIVLGGALKTGEKDGITRKGLANKKQVAVPDIGGLGYHRNRRPLGAPMDAPVIPEPAAIPQPELAQEHAARLNNGLDLPGYARPVQIQAWAVNAIQDEALRAQEEQIQRVLRNYANRFNVVPDNN